MADIRGQKKFAARKRRERRVRSRIHGTSLRPRLSIYRSLTNIYAQIINDETGQTLVSASTVDREIAKKLDAEMDKRAAARLVGEVLAVRAQAVGIEQVVFDRGGFRYHGRIAALADAARDAGLKF
ncbi:MAG: 50S ribosomal protein L18 [Phototrophicaceae bacterium]|jgi:large subunit ribosomal protein L18